MEWRNLKQIVRDELRDCESNAEKFRKHEHKAESEIGYLSKLIFLVKLLQLLPADEDKAHMLEPTDVKKNVPEKKLKKTFKNAE